MNTFYTKKECNYVPLYFAMKGKQFKAFRIDDKYACNGWKIFLLPPHTKSGLRNGEYIPDDSKHENYHCEQCVIEIEEKDNEQNN